MLTSSLEIHTETGLVENWNGKLIDFIFKFFQRLIEWGFKLFGEDKKFYIVVFTLQNKNKSMKSK